MSRVIAAYDLDEDHGRLWVNANLKRMPDVVIVANQPMDRSQTVTYVPEARLEEMDAGTCKIHDCEGGFSAVNRPVWRCDCGAFMTQYTYATADELRLIADIISERGVTSDDIAIIKIRLREAADTIEGLRGRMHLVPAELDYSEDKSRWHELFGTPERAARTLAVGDKHADCGECVIREACYSSDMGCLVEEPEALLEWLRVDA